MNDFEKKDLILKTLNDNLIPSRFNSCDINHFIELTGFDKNRIDSILHGMKSDGLINYEGISSHNEVLIEPREKLYEFFSIGGYTTKFSLLDVEIKKIHLELKELEKKVKIEDLSNLSTFVSNISSMLFQLYS